MATERRGAIVVITPNQLTHLLGLDEFRFERVRFWWDHDSDSLHVIAERSDLPVKEEGQKYWETEVSALLTGGAINIEGINKDG